MICKALWISLQIVHVIQVSQEKLFHVTDVTESVCTSPCMCETMLNDTRNIAGRYQANVKL